MDVEKEGPQKPLPGESSNPGRGSSVSKVDLKSTLGNDVLPPLLRSDFESALRSKTSLRLIYEAQTQVIQKQIGDLESVREKLGLNARKICQLLMVDPSAWNRWTRPGHTAPPHIWRALQWYMIVQEKLPGLSPQFFIERVVTKVEKVTEKTVERVVDIPRETDFSSPVLDPDFAAHLEERNQLLNQDLGEIRQQSQTLLTQIETQNELLKSQAEQIQRLKMTLVVGLCLCFGLVIGPLSYQVKRANTPAWENLPSVEDSAN